MPPSLRKAVAAAIGGGAIAIASVLITGPSGNDGLEGVSYIPYKDIVGVWTVCHGHTGKDIMLGKTYTEAECKALLNKDLATVARQINPYIKVDILGFDLSSLSLNANGGIYQSADLSRYSGTVVNRPTFFAFAKGAGVMGEAGPEAILPLRRGADGKLGVVADIFMPRRTSPAVMI